ncbi:MAG: phospho-N-acetylmuramoyl-pentapeptide-transferase [Phycisphaeraceae bacterium]|nr:phospho-N-acetylmuramoyl-pentapeptide-transferase [Phycisphaeraceae bacterium]
MLYLLLDETRGWLDAQGLYRYVRVLDQIEFRVLSSAAFSFLIVLLLGRRTIRYLLRMKIGDSGLSDAEALRAHTASKAKTPTMGGVLIAGAILVSTVTLADIRVFWVTLGLLVLLWMAVLGGVDDWLKLTASRRGGGRQGLFAWEKLVFQLGLGLLVGWFAYSHAQSEGIAFARALNLPFQRSYEPGGTMEPASAVILLPRMAYVVVAILLIAGMSNAVNITDGMDGLAAGISAFVFLGLVVLALIAGSSTNAQYLLVPHIPGASEVGVLAGATAGACLGFLWWNCSPAQVFMGDTGSLCLGGLLAYISIVIRQEIVLLLMSGVFLMEIASVVLQVGYFRSTGGKRIFKCAPYHHHLHLSGWTEQQVVSRAWIVAIVLVVLGLASIKLR